MNSGIDRNHLKSFGMFRNRLESLETRGIGWKYAKSIRGKLDATIKYTKVPRRKLDAVIKFMKASRGKLSAVIKCTNAPRRKLHTGIKYTKAPRRNRSRKYNLRKLHAGTVPGNQICESSTQEALREIKFAKAPRGNRSRQ